MQTINNKSDLKFFLKQRNDSLRINFLEREADNHFYSQQINKYKNACGCNTGSVFTGISLLICILLKFTILHKLHFSVPQQILFAGFLIIFFSLVGKMIGIINAKIKLKKLVQKLMDGNI